MNIADSCANPPTRVILCKFESQWLCDSAEFMELLASFKHVKAFIFGHSHDWSIKKRGSLHLVNLPPVAYVFVRP